MKTACGRPFDSRSRVLVLGLLAVLACGSAEAQFTLDREPVGPSSRKTGLVITEIMYNPRPVAGLSTNLTLEFVELFNSKPWEENIGGFAIDGSVHYTFASNTVLSAGAYLVVARVPGMIQTNYAITNVVGPWDGATTNRLPTDIGTVRLRNRQGAVLLEVNYHDSPPWPEAADGTGHSLSLVRPSYGEGDYRAWAESDSVGGSPGGPDPITYDPLASVFINEWQNHSDPLDWLELYNHSNVPVDLSGAWLSDTPLTNKYRIPNGTTIPARGFLTWDQNQLGFELFAGGESIFFVNSNQTRVIDAIDFRGQSNNVTSGRFPDGGPIIYGLTSGTRGARNSAPLRYPVVINEIMYNPISGDNNDEYVELYNRGSGPVNLGGWEFIIGITYVFPTNAHTIIAPGGFLVVAKNPTNLFAIYSNLNTNNTVGPYSGTLGNGGERLTLAAADYDTVQMGTSNVEVKLNVPVSDVIYGDSGKWGNWSDGDGASLELIDPEADTHLPSNWADSDDTGESQWTAIEWTGPLGETLGPVVNDSIIIMMQGLGECLVDEVEVRVDNGPNLVANGGFEDGLTGWTLQGSHDFSTIENSGFAGNQSLHVRAGSRGDNQSNRILSAPFATPFPANPGVVSIRAKAKWLRGHPELLVRLHGGGAEAYGWLALPRKLGTPGTVNSRRVANAGPGIYEVKHAPILPAADGGVVITARAYDRQGVAAMTVKYRVDPTPDYTDLTMTDDGTGGDAVANDGIYSATIPGQPAGAIVAFYVEGRDGAGATATFPSDLFPAPGLTRCWPNDAVARECVVRWGEVQMPGDFATYHLWLTSANSNRWATRNPMDNAPMDGTFVYNNSRVVYNALPYYSGSPWHRTNSTTGPAGPNRVDYVMSFPGDDAMLGSTDFVLNNPGNPEIDVISDLSGMAEQTVNKIIDGMGPGLVHNHRRYIHLFVNGSQRSTTMQRPGNFIFEDSQQPNGDMIDQWFSSDAGGQLFKAEDWFEFENDGFQIEANNDADLTRRTILLNGQPTLVPAPYRFMFRKRSVNIGSSANDYSLIFDLIDAASPADNPTNAVIDPDLFLTVADWEEWMRFFAVQRTVGNWDSYGWERGKNDYFYKPVNSGFTHMTWDIDYCMGLGRGPTEPLFYSNDPRVAAMFNTPVIVRAYWRAFADLVNGPFTRENLDPFLDGRTAALLANNVNIDLDAVAAIKNYITDRRAFLQSQLATVTVPFVVDGPDFFSTTNNLLILTGTAPVAVKTISLNGAAYPLTWISATSFVMRVVLDSGINGLTLQGFDRFGTALADAVYTLNVDYTGPVPNPVGSLIISEIMFAPAIPGAQFVEIVNHSDQNFGLSGWRLDGANLTFQIGSIVTNGQTIVVAQNKDAFKAVYGNVPVFAVFGGILSTQQVLALVKPTTSGDLMVNGVHYDTSAPWPPRTNGESLQLIDLSQDNSRVSNWSTDAVTPATPGASNSVVATLQPYDALWLNELQLESVSGPLDNFGERDPWLELYNSGLTPINLDGYYLATNFTNNLMQWQFPSGAIIAPGEYKMIWTDGQPEQTSDTNIHTSFRLDNRGKLALVRLSAGQPQITDYLRWGNLPANVSYGGYRDGQAVYRFTLYTPTPGTTNTGPALRVFINEWMTKNTTGIRDPADNAQDDWFEIFNGESFTVDLGGYYFSDAAGLTTKYRVPANGHYTVPPGGFLLVWADNQTNENSLARSGLHVNFQLSSSAGVIGLYAPDGTNVVDLISYGQQSADISEGRYTDGASARYFMTQSTPAALNVISGYNTAPRFPDFTNRVASPGQTISISIRAADPETSSLNLNYSIVSAPPDVTLFLGGTLRWIISSNQSLGDYVITVRATDNGVPQRSDTASLIVTVATPSAAPVVPGTPPPFIHSVTLPDGRISFTIDTIPGHTYRVFYKDDLNAPAWTQLDRDFVAANTTASITDFAATTQRFYRALRVD